VILTFGEDLQDFGLGNWKRRLLVRGLAACHKVIPISSYTASLAAGLGVPPEKVAIVHPGIDPEPYINVSNDEALALKNRLGLSNRAVILTLARLDERKGHDIVIEALPAICKSVPNAHYLIVGKGDPSQLCEKAAELGVAERMSIVDYMHNDELPVLFAMADVHAMISRQEPSTGALEGFGICYLEAAACGRPSISGNVGGPVDAVVDGVTGYHVDVLDSEAVADHISSLLTDRCLAEKMGNAGREMVLDRFTKTAMLNGIGSVVHEAVTS
jgi:phosphatidylinositol alpha-1,6-mannosyltransferase